MLMMSNKTRIWRLSEECTLQARYIGFQMSGFLCAESYLSDYAPTLPSTQQQSSIQVSIFSDTEIDPNNRELFAYR